MAKVAHVAEILPQTCADSTHSLPHGILACTQDQIHMSNPVWCMEKCCNMIFPTEPYPLQTSQKGKGQSRIFSCKITQTVFTVTEHVVFMLNPVTSSKKKKNLLTFVYEV